MQRALVTSDTRDQTNLAVLRVGRMVGVLRLLGDGLRETGVDVGRWCRVTAAAAVAGVDVVARVATGRLLSYLSVVAAWFFGARTGSSMEAVEA